MIIGGDIAGVGQGAAWDPAGEWMVVEADESDRTFIQLGAEAVAVTSVGSDHLEYYGTRAELDRAFIRFIAEAPGPAVVCVDDAGARTVIRSIGPAAERRLVTYGASPNAAVRIDGVDLLGDRATFYLEENGVRRGPVSLAVPGLHNVLNATAALALATTIGVPWDEAVHALSAYRGVGRRFETRGRVDGVTFVDDYAHNPEKVAAALATARIGLPSRVVAVFQPHRYSRTEALWREFGPSLSDADVLIVTGIYAAGEPPRPGISGQLIAQAVRDARRGARVRYAETLDEAELILREELRDGDLCITLGAGDVTGLASRFLKRGNPNE
jgi:UDP-N-acetylmuramate--alanine ligase